MIARRERHLAPSSCKVWLGGILVAAGVVGCSHEERGDGDFVPYLASQITALGGSTNNLLVGRKLPGKWSTTHNASGTTIELREANFSDLTDILTSAYEAPQTYSPANRVRGPIYIYPPWQVGATLSIANYTNKAEVTLIRRDGARQ